MLNHQPLFSVKEVNAKIKSAFPNGIPNKAQKIKIIENWQQNLCSGKYRNAKEEEVKPLFLTQFFGEILGYEYNNANDWNLKFEQKTNIDSTKADAALGFFSTDDKSDIRVAVEIKDARTALDKPQNRKDFKGSSVEQGFMYASKIGEKCKWVIVSNFLEIRLYLASDMTKYEKFDILGLTDEYEFARFYYLLAYGQLFLENISSIIDVFLEQRIEKERLITTAFYNDYHECRELFYCHLKRHNPDIEQLQLLEYAQTIIDRVVFVSVVKDYDLISYNILKEIEDISSKSFAQDKGEFWRQLKYLFLALDKGLPTRVQKFNGGLFAPNQAIDNLVIKDVMLRRLFKLNAYDFESDLNINVLGHIFEQSITDIELLKKDILEGNTLEYTETDDEINFVGSSSSAGLRKKDGIFYTPENITRYILKSTLGVWLDERKKEIGLDEEDLTFPKFEEYKQVQIKKWEQYKTVLKSVKILDPACGSGAFLTQSFDFLFSQWQIVVDVLEKLKDEKIELKVSGLFTEATLDTTSVLSQIRKDIVTENLFGVDLNFESVEITKLGLWLKSASKNDSLTSLDNNVKGGNSLIDDSTLTEKAFVWQNEFPHILNNGGFDFVLGNPPYVDSKRLKPYSNHFSQYYSCYSGTADLYVYFYELAFKLLKTNGIMGFISSNKFMKTTYGENLRKFLTTKNIQQIVDFTDYRVFEDALVASSIVIVKNEPPQENIKISFVNRNLDNYETVEDYVIENHFYTQSSNLDHQIWFLSANGKLPLKRKIEANSTQLKDIEGVSIYRGVTTGYNEAFIIDEITKRQLIDKDEKNAEIIKPLLQGRNIRKWFYNESNLYMVFIPWHFPLHNDKTIVGASEKAEIELKKEYKSLYKHLEIHKENLLKRNVDETGIRYEWYALQRCAATYYPEFEKEKVIWGLTADKWAYCYDDKGHFLPSNGYILTSTSQLSVKFILGVLNSKLMRFYFDFIGIMTAGGAFTLKYDTVAEFPFKVVSLELQQAIIERVNELISLAKITENWKQKFPNRLLTNFDGIKINPKLKAFYDNDFKSLLGNLKKQKINLSFKQQDELEEYFNEHKTKIDLELEQRRMIEKQIDNLVYKLYDLTSEEIEIIENSIK